MIFNQMKYLIKFNKNKWHTLIKMTNDFLLKCDI